MTNEPSAEKPTDQWVTGDEPMTGPQRSYLETLAREAGEALPEDMTKAEASEAIERLQARGAEAVILGCTEIGMLIDDSNSPLPAYDTTDLHARALVEAALA